VFLSIAADTVAWPDSFGWLPIHYACGTYDIVSRIPYYDDDDDSYYPHTPVNTLPLPTIELNAS